MVYSDKFCLLLTGTVNPTNVPFLKRDNSLSREQDYIKSLEQWTQLGIPIVFVENSNYESKTINNIVIGSKGIEYLKFTSSRSHLGKSSGEAEIISYGLNESKIIQSCEYIIKVTGRYYVPNIYSILRMFENEPSLDLVVWLKRNFEFGDSRLFIGRVNFYKDYLRPEFAIIDESVDVYFEHALARATHRYMADGYKWQLPKFAPTFQGISGTDNYAYKNDMFRKFKRNIILKVTKFLIKLQY